VAGNSKLETYRAKRDFKVTNEPSGDASVMAAARRRFVIQKHDATRLHYDLRLELDGVFKSWAVTKGPSIDPHDKRLAVEVEDHPLDYGDFEGTIPQGEYGGGTVQLWDRGYWVPEGDRSPEEALAHGDFKFSLDGARLHGSWVLVRMKSERMPDKRNNWLLIKHRDEHARGHEAAEALLAEDKSIASGRTMETIAAGKGRAPKPFVLGATGAADAVWGIQPAAKAAKTKAVTKTAEKLPDFLLPQLCTAVDRPPSGAGWGHEIKLDGYRLQLRVQDGKAVLKTRKGVDWSAKFGAIINEAKVLPNAIIDGEAVALDEHGAPDFSALQAALSEQKTDDLIFFAFDLLFMGNEDMRERPLSVRKTKLQELLGTVGAKRIRFVEHLSTGGDAILKSACKMALEGIVSKKLDASYRGGRTENWVKSKCRGGHEVVLGGWTTTNGRFRSLLAGVYRGKHLIYVGRVSTGYGPAMVKNILPRLKAAAATKSPFTGLGAPRAEPNINWLKPELVAEIEFAGWTRDGNIR